MAEKIVLTTATTVQGKKDYAGPCRIPVNFEFPLRVFRPNC